MHEKAGPLDQSHLELFDAVVIGGGPSGATAATDLAKRGFSVLLLDRAGRIKPCGAPSRRAASRTSKFQTN